MPGPIGTDADLSMSVDRQRYGLLVSCLGAMLLAVSVFLPWYGLSFTAAGVALVQQLGNEVAAQFGNAALQSYAASAHNHLGGLAGHPLGGVSAHQVLKHMNVLLLVVAGLGIALALVPLALSRSLLTGGDGQLLALLGGLASLCVAYRMVVPPSPVGGLIAFSLREGAWLALLGSLAMVVGGLMPRSGAISGRRAPSVQGAWAELSGWTPET